MKKLYALALAATCVFGASASTEYTYKATTHPQINSANNTIKLRTAVKSQAPEFKTNADVSDYTWTSLGTGKYAASVVPDTYGALKILWT